MSDTPTPDEVDAAIRSVALAELDGMRAGSTVMVSECIGYKKMSRWWNFRMRCWRIENAICVKLTGKMFWEHWLFRPIYLRRKR